MINQKTLVVKEAEPGLDVVEDDSLRCDSDSDSPTHQDVFSPRIQHRISNVAGRFVKCNVSTQPVSSKAFDKYAKFNIKSNQGLSKMSSAPFPRLRDITHQRFIGVNNTTAT